MRKLLCVLCMVLFCGMLFAAGFTYEVNSTGITFTSGSYTGALVIPSTMNGKKVTCIGDSAFSECDSLTSVTIPDSVTSIGDGAFDDNPSLTFTVSKGSYAARYAKENRLNYQYPIDWL